MSAVHATAFSDQRSASVGWPVSDRRRHALPRSRRTAVTDPYVDLHIATQSGQSSPIAERQQNTVKPTSPGLLGRPAVSASQRCKVDSRPCPWSARTAEPIGASAPPLPRPPRAAGSQPHRRTCRATADQPSTRAACLPRLAGRCHTELKGPGATLTRVRLRPGRAVVAALLPLPSSAPTDDAPTRRSLHPSPGKPCRKPPRPLPRGDLIPAPPGRPARAACRPPPSACTLRLTPAARAVGSPDSPK